MELRGGPAGLVQVNPVGCANFKSITNNSTFECAVNNNTIEVHRLSRTPKRRRHTILIHSVRIYRAQKY